MSNSNMFWQRGAILREAYRQRNTSSRRKTSMHYPVLHVSLVFLCSRKLPKEGTTLQKHVGVWYVS